MLRCYKCKLSKAEEAFGKCASRKTGRQPMCKECSAAYSHARWRNNKAAGASYARKYKKRLRDEMFTHYGTVCACCGEYRKEFLALDHVNGGGYEHRKAGAIAVLLRREGYPKDGRYQILCHNCNVAKGANGECPHKRELSLHETTANYGDRSEGSLDPSLRSGSEWFIQ